MDGLVFLVSINSLRASPLSFNNTLEYFILILLYCKDRIIQIVVTLLKIKKVAPQSATGILNHEFTFTD